MAYCEGCNTRYVDTDCGQAREHARCPAACGLCALPITGRDTGCHGHTMQEVTAHVDLLRRR